MVQNIRQSFDRLWPLALLVYLPFLIVSASGVFLITHWLEYSREVIAFFLLSSIGYGLLVLFPVRARRHLLPLVLGFCSLSACLKMGFYLLYQTRYSASALFVIFETNTEEVGDFVTAYINGPLLLLVVILAIPFVASLFIAFTNRGFARLRGSLRQKQPVLLLVLVTVLILGSAWTIKKRYANENIALTSISAYKEFQQVRQNLSDALAKPLSTAFDEVVADSTKQTHVIVIGESTSSWHMQLYGYGRQTNPLLNKRAGLLAFNDIITPHVHTLLALEKILTMACNSDPKPAVNGSVVQLANQAGYKTFWVSNQQPVGLHESISTIIGSAADEKKYLSTNGYQYTVYDEALFKPFQEALSDPAERKIIFVHLIGTHARYYKRYPKEFSVFQGQDYPSKFKSEDASREINEYDNAVLYNDMIIDSMIQFLDARAEKRSLLYLSDHGDEVYDTMEMAGHNEYWATSPMYQVPFLVWSPSSSINPSWQDRPYLLDDFIHSFAELTNIRFLEWDPSKSVFNPEFQVKQRFVNDGEDFDLRPKTGLGD
ncbi:sulfatase-like hydrolase/transferase [Aureitalea marina]|uniref:Sulfatase N-terminal domain-containing protein n=1 Tax=Aureitalea marina TaxID=930804 RepID=A0A2S7KS69_9FLAO|nr:sulfatase-like hydrolase/transferase [Aureitalea marina]PQB05460.1 hypothetical protein BST85_11590 [Aureitalea marina]